MDCRLPQRDSGTSGCLTSPGAWISGMQDFNSANASNWDINQDLTKSPLWPYTGHTHGIFQCPSDQSRVVPTSGPFRNQSVRRVRRR
jgi:hypothetical protein